MSDANAPRIIIVNGRILLPPDLYRDGLLRALEGRDVRRLGICPICNELFVRRRAGQPGCGRAHSHTIWTRAKRREGQEKKTGQKAAGVDPYKDPRPRYEETRKLNLLKKKERQALRARARKRAEERR
jgi:hypothetical protein